MVDQEQLVIVAAAPKKNKKFTVEDFMTDQDLNSQAICLEFSDKPVEGDMETKQSDAQESFELPEAKPLFEVETQSLKQEENEPRSVRVSQESHEVNEQAS